MDRLLNNIPGVAYFIDDVLVSASTIDKLKSRLRQTLSRLASAKLRAQMSKCIFSQETITHLGYRIDKYSQHPTD